MPEHDATPGPERAATAQPIERRAFVRVASDLTATCHPAARGDPGWPGKVRDISRGGIGLLLRHRFQPGMRLAVELRGANGVFLRTAAVRVAHARAVFADGDHCWLLGCAFDEPLSDAEFAALAGDEPAAEPPG